MPDAAPAPRTAPASSPILIAVAWLVVILPTAWGLTLTAKNALKIFERTPAPTAPAPAPTR
jgi:hypothetical protein